ncbi:hypothetical protein V5O48_013499 [Marasmius crinis-equi]|uniref:Uncharacterized protein n=1 Tax=Marasmius crinis-equi TaxID=585013 RepID=A0ABR3F008_9AGAR
MPEDETSACSGYTSPLPPIAVENPASESNSSPSVPSLGSTANDGAEITTPLHDMSKAPNPDHSGDNSTTPNPEQSKEDEQSHLEDGEDQAVDEEKEEEAVAAKKGKKTKGKRGAQSNFTDEEIAYFESKIPEYEALENSKKKKTQFWADFMPAFFERFPDAVGRKANVKERDDPAQGLTEESFKSMEPSEQQALQKHIQRFKCEAEECYRDSVKNTFNYLRKKQNKAQANPFQAPLKKVKNSCGTAPQRAGLPQFVAKCPEYKEQVVALSKETGHKDRLPCQITAAKSLIETFSEEELERANELMEEDYQEKVEDYIGTKVPDEESGLDLERELERAKCRRSLAVVVEPFINFIREHTGMAVFFQAGVELDHPDRGRAFDVFSMCSVPTGAPKLADYDMNFFQEHFGKTFADWLRAVKRQQIEAGVEFPEFLDVEEPRESTRKPQLQGGNTTKSAEVESGKGGKRKTATKKKAAPSPPAEQSTSAAKKAPSPPAKQSTSTANKAPSLSSFLSTSSKDDLFATAPPAPDHVPGQSYADFRAARIAWHQSLFTHLGLSDASNTASTSATNPASAALVPNATSPRPNTPPILTAAQPDADGESVDMVVDVVDDENGVDKEGKGDEDGCVIHQGSENGDALRDPVPEPSLKEPSSPKADGSQNSNEKAGVPSPAAAPNSTNEEPNVAGEPHSNPASPSSTSHSGGLAQPKPMQPLLMTDASFFDSIQVPRLPSDQRYPLAAVHEEWIRDLAGMMMQGEVSANDVWVASVYRWVELEEKWGDFGYDVESLPTKSRPVVYKAWFKAGRASRPGGYKTPKGVKLPEWRESWWNWLSGILADQCIQDETVDVAVPLDYSEAQGLECRGRDGISLLLMGLKWWYEMGGKEDVEGVGHWEHTTKAMYRSMGILLENCHRQSPESENNRLSTGNRRKSPDTPSTHASKPLSKRRRVSQK